MIKIKNIKQACACISSNGC